MSYNYRNFFKPDDGTYAHPVSFNASLNTDPTTKNTGALGGLLGNMKVANTGNISPNVTKQHPGLDEGFIFAFKNDFGPQAGKFASQTIYIVDPVGVSEINNRLNAAGTLFAEIEFDSPRATTVDGTESTNYQTTWAVGVNFKTGDEQDGGESDTLIGPTCQFVDGGRINFNFTNSDQSKPGNYDMYADRRTRFKLLVAVRRTGSAFDAGGMLFLDGDPVFFGSIADPGFGFLADAKTSKQVITAAGGAIANTGKDVTKNSLISEVSVRLIAFRLSWNFPEIELVRFPRL